MKRLDLNNPFGAAIYHDEIVTSTFDVARVLALKNESHGTVICADFQEAGRGRLKRSWAAEKCKSLLFTILLRYDDYASIPDALTLRTGLAVSLAIEDLILQLMRPALTGQVKIKWPNDVMLNSCKAEAVFKKAAGILTEADGKNVYIGVGVNVAQEEFPEEYRSKAISLAQLCPSLPLNARFLLLEKILKRLYEEFENMEEVGASLHWRSRIHDRLYKIGETVIFAEGSADSGSLITGTLSGIGPDGELLIIPDGEKKERAFVTGELRVY